MNIILFYWKTVLDEKKKNYRQEFNKLNEKDVINDERIQEDE